MNKNTKIGLIIWGLTAIYAIFFSRPSDEYFNMYHYYQRLENRDGYLKICELIETSKVVGEVTHIKEDKGGAKTISININQQESSINSFFSISSHQIEVNTNIIKLWIDYKYEAQPIFIGSHVKKEMASSSLRFHHVRGDGYVNLFPDRYIFSSCEDATNMDIKEEFLQYLHFGKESGELEELSPEIYKQIEKILHDSTIVI